MLKIKKESSLQKSNALVEFKTNKYLHGSYHHNKFQEIYNLDKFLTLIQSSNFKEHKEFNEISNFFKPSIEIITKEILDDLNENGLKRKESRLSLFLDDLKDAIKLYKCVLEDIDLTDLELLYKSARKHIMAQNSNLVLAIADIMNLQQQYQLLEKTILENILKNLSKFVEGNYKYVLGQFWYDDDKTPYQRNITENHINRYIKLLYIILMNKNITKKEIIDLFKKLISMNCEYWNCTMDNKNVSFFQYDYPVKLDDTFDLKSEYYYEVSIYINSLTITDRFNRFIELLNEEKQCFYIFQILNTELSKTNEVSLGGITYYNENILKSKGSKYTTKNQERLKDHFGAKESKQVKAMISYKTKRYFSNISALKARSIIENNISFFKLIQSQSDEKADYFKPSASKMDVSYSYFMLDSEYYFISKSLTSYDGDTTFNKNTIIDGIFTNNEMNQKLDVLMKHLNYKQTENSLTTNDYLILQSLQKYKQSIESTNFTDLLLLSWNGLEHLANAIDNNNKVYVVQNFVSLVYSFIYTNDYYKWDLSNKELVEKINNRAKHLVVYAYTYRNKIVHSHLLEDSLMISVSKGINIIFKQLLILLLEKIILSSDFELKNVINQLQSDLNNNTKKMKNKNKI